jgi:hypothetical protein
MNKDEKKEKFLEKPLFGPYNISAASNSHTHQRDSDRGGSSKHELAKAGGIQ